MENGTATALAPPSVTNDAPGAYITEIGSRKFLVNEAANRIEFIDNRFYKCSDGTMVPSVTTLLDAWPKGAQYYEWLKKHGQDSDEIRDEAGRRGSVVHNLTELVDMGGEARMCGDDGSPKFLMSEWAMLERYADFRRIVKPEILEIELNMASAKLGYAGTLDRVMVIADEPWIIDIKTSAAVYDHHHLQTAAYLSLYAEARGLPDMRVLKFRRGILHLNAKTRSYGKGEAIQGPGWQLVETDKSFEEDMDLFDACAKLWHSTNKNTKPKAMSYALSVKIDNNQPVNQ